MLHKIISHELLRFSLAKKTDKYFFTVSEQEYMLTLSSRDVVIGPEKRVHVRYYIEAGNTRWVMGLHGNGHRETGLLWSKMLPTLGRNKYNVLLVDGLGRGKSTPGPVMGIKNNGGDIVHCVLDDFAVPHSGNKVHFLAQCGGANCAIQAYLTRPVRFSHSVFDLTTTVANDMTRFLTISHRNGHNMVFLQSSLDHEHHPKTKTGKELATNAIKRSSTHYELRNGFYFFWQQFKSFKWKQTETNPVYNNLAPFLGDGYLKATFPELSSSRDKKLEVYSMNRKMRALLLAAIENKKQELEHLIEVMLKALAKKVKK